MTHDAFFQAIKSGEIANVYLFHGEEEHIKESALEQLRQAVLPPGLETMNETRLSNPRADDILAAAQTLPLLCDRRLIVVRDSLLLSGNKAQAEAEDVAKLSGYIDRPNDTACVLFYCRGVADGRKKLTQLLKKSATTVQFDPLNDATLVQWIRRQLKKGGKNISPANASLVAFTAGNALLTLTQELSKLSAFIGERTEITQHDIEAVITPSLECTIFQLIDALVENRQAEAFRLLQVMLENGESRIGILAMMARQYRNLLHLRLMQDEHCTQSEMQKRLGVQSFALRRLTAQVQGATPKALQAKLDLFVDTDYAIKSGKMREDAALERAMLMLCTIP